MILGGLKLPRSFEEDQRWSSEKIQPLANKIYSKVWPDCQILDLEDDQKDSLKQALDFGGVDKAIRLKDGTIGLLAQRFRRYTEREYDDFTLRYSRPRSQYKTECEKALKALKENRMVAGYYAYFHVNKEENGFSRFRIIKFREFLEYWRDGKLPKPQLKHNRDGSAIFLAWSFSKLPRELFFYELNENVDKLPLNQILCGDCVEILKGFPENSIDLVVTDPPYGLGFMGKEWDRALPPREAFEQVKRVLKPGALAFIMSSPRQDLLWRMCAMLDSVGFEMKQSFINWVYKTGFPKAYDVQSNITKNKDKYIKKGIDNYNSWEDIKFSTNSKTVNIVEKSFLKSLIETGANTNKKNTVAENVSHYLSQKKSNVYVNAVEKRLNEVHPTLEGNIFFVVENADMNILPLNSSVKTVVLNLQDLDQMLIAKLVFVPVNAQTYFTQKTQELIIKAEEAQKTEHGEKPSWNETTINALIVEAISDFKHTISNQLKNTLNLDMTFQTGLPFVINVIITKSIKACLTSVMENILEKKLKDESKNWDGWKSQTGLKPAFEPILMVNKPFSEKTIVDNVLKWGTGAINIDATRIPLKDSNEIGLRTTGGFNSGGNSICYGDSKGVKNTVYDQGRFPANLIVSDGALDTGELSKSGDLKPHHNLSKDENGYAKTNVYGKYTRIEYNFNGDLGDQSRYFDLDAWAEHHGILDVPKPDTSERDYGLRGVKTEPKSKFNKSDGKTERFDGAISIPRRNTHPTVKPIQLMAYLIELGCPKDGIVLDPFVGSGTTCIAAKKLCRRYIGIEIDKKYHALAEARIAAYPQPLEWFTDKEGIIDG